VLAPVLAVQFDLPPEAFLVLMATLTLGTPSLTLIGAIGAALTVGVRGAGVLTSLLVLPLYVPVLILGTGAVDAAAGGLGVQAHLMLLAAFLVFATAFAPWATAAALRISLD
jgi:heme exporter protein B